ncbi:hypothetical protein NUH86_11020 [Sphingobium sp. JS3065]|uniref:hypothetical protein n=1 Tax=Sphingobium sp. JS3065 TaxID=2970925 RepID=UPI00226521A3|nr:hypothetical protein [Sphingobium sp. JS3065]UZW54066.1 hypothetical protein NUH86_11020 [Sphingobium sp. JS3065]
MDPTLKNALAQPSVLLFGALKIALPTYTLRLLDGAGTLQIAGETYVGCDDLFGTIAELSELTEEIGDQAPEITIKLLPPNISAAATLASPDMQGCSVQLLVGAVNMTTGTVIGVPEVVFLGEVDVPTVDIDAQGERSVSFTVVSVFERLFEVEEGQRASNGWHQSIWPGELGLEHMTGTDVNLYWGAKPPQASGQKSGLAGLLQRAAAARPAL